MKPKGYWNIKKNCIADALQYSTRNSWKNGIGMGYLSACKNRWLEECCKHMRILGTKHKRLIYAFEFPDKSVYVGLTFNSIMRKNKHLNDTESQVNRYTVLSGLEPEFKLLTDYEDIDLASRNETKFLEKYKEEGWKILNKAKTGGLGGNVYKHTLNSCLNSALTCKSRSEFIKKFPNQYQSAYKNGWLEQCCLHMRRPINIFLWSKKNCLNNSLLFTNKTKWKKESKGAYKSAKKNGWFDECTLHMKRPLK